MGHLVIAPGMEKNPTASLLIGTKKQKVEIQKYAHFLHLLGNAILSRVTIRKSQETK